MWKEHSKAATDRGRQRDVGCGGPNNAANLRIMTIARKLSLVMVVALVVAVVRGESLSRRRRKFNIHVRLFAPETLKNIDNRP